MAVLRDNYSGTAEPYIALTLNAANDWAGQTFTTTAAYSISRIDIWCAKGVGDNVGNITVALYATSAGDPTGSPLASGTIADADIGDTTSYAWATCNLSAAYNLSNTTKYAIVVHGVSLDASNVLIWSYDDDGLGASDFANGDQLWSTDGGSSWATDTTQDQLFRCYGTNIPLADKRYSKKVVSISNNEVWYGSDATTLTELTAANADINTANPLTAFEAFQKLCIVNRTNLKIADFANSKITTAAVGTNPPDRGIVLTGQTSGAEMVTDYITSDSGACTIYGFRTTSATFQNAEQVLGTNLSTSVYGSAVDFTTNAAEVAAPHWYDWTVYANDTTNFGTMPTDAYISCLYRGRAILAGNPNYPHQWYMSRVAHIFDFLYGSTDPLTAVAGNNTDAGELGDIIRALIPYGDDFLVFGAANSIHILTGDPAFSGQIDEIESNTGVFSPWSWCRDEKGNLYFWGANGIYMMRGGRSRPENISEGVLPKLVGDWAIDPSLHRIVLNYDPSNHGIIVSKTTLSDGTNLNYFYDLKISGFYPETYPKECAIFCGGFYDADDSTVKGLMLGCNDGYIRRFDYSAKDDDIGATDEAISSYVTLEMIVMSDDDNSEGKLTSLTVELGGGASGGDFSDSDAVSYDIHVAEDAETCLEDIKDGATPRETGTFTGTGRFRIRKRVRGRYLGIRFYNSTASETFVLNMVSGSIVPAGTL